MNPLLSVIQSQLQDQRPIYALFLVQGEWISIRHPQFHPEGLITGLSVSFGQTCWIDVNHVVAFRCAEKP